MILGVGCDSSLQIVPEDIISLERSAVIVVVDCDDECTAAAAETKLTAGAPYELVLDAKDSFGNSRAIGK